ncbi:biopolymer transporter ExbD [Balneolaceae bacterium ANBcel3]|nr:biopolymer transporter ExbD [Balneolaceae bacterium ANBcel3]
MKKTTFLIRFIDIGLIILFGFIVISDITIRSQIELPGSDPSEQTEDRDLMLFVINIDLNDQYRLTDFHESITHGTFTGVESLEPALRSLNKNIIEDGKSPVALIQIDESVTIQRLIDILDLCDRLGIPKNVNIESFRL